jgi:4-hydroxythreonine-4-phosphate dehydrogenase
MTDRVPRLAITMGDPAGVGPEIIVKACRRLLPRIEAGGLRLLVIGHRSALHAAQTLLHETLEFASVEDAPLAFLSAGEEAEPIVFGRIAPEAGRFAYLAVEQAVKLALAGRIDAIVTAPLNKEALNLAGYHFAGHTDMLAALTHTRSSVMLLAHGDMRVGHVTTHVALADVPKLLTPERLRRTIDLTHAAVRDLGIAEPRVAVAALNPHAGEGGLFGREEIDIIKPAIDAAAHEGVRVSGPFGAATMFHKTDGDAFIVMLHDQGHITAKLLARRATAGLAIGSPILFSSVAHGSGHDIVGKGVADPAALIQAIGRLAGAGRRHPSVLGKPMAT